MRRRLVVLAALATFLCIGTGFPALGDTDVAFTQAIISDPTGGVHCGMTVNNPVAINSIQLEGRASFSCSKNFAEVDLTVCVLNEGNNYDNDLKRDCQVYQYKSASGTGGLQPAWHDIDFGCWHYRTFAHAVAYNQSGGTPWEEYGQSYHVYYCG